MTTEKGTSAKAPTAVSHRYAKALLELAEETKAIDKVEKDLKDLSAMIAESADLRTLISSPLVNKDKKFAAIGDLAKKAKLQKTTNNFLNVLIENNRLDILPMVITAFNMKLSASRGEVTIKVTTAQDMTAKQTKDLAAALSKGMNAEVAIQAKVEPSILGGMIVTVGSHMIDASVARKLERLKASMAKQANSNITELKEVG